MAVALAAAATTSAQAADWYVGGALGQSRVGGSLGGAAAGFTVTKFDRTDTGFKLLAGVNLSPNFAVEGGYVGLGKASLTVTEDDGESAQNSASGNRKVVTAHVDVRRPLEDGGNSVSVSGNLKGHGYFVDLVGKLPLAQNWGLFGKVGLFHGKAKVSAGNESDSDSGTSYKFGVGAEYALTKSVAVRGEWERYRFKVFGDAGNVNLLSVGVTLAF
ncbi:MAG: porin family protein [Aquabacterium sp.]|nr:porin family protein [Aquabacterium sp.]